MSYEAGDTYYATVTVTDADGAPTDPQTLTLKVRAPAGTVTTYLYATDDIIVRDSVGVFHADVLLSAAGMWTVQWETTNAQEVEGIQIAVAAAPTSGVTFATVDELALRLGHAGAGALTAAQAAQGQMLLEFVTGLIVEAIDKTDAWAAALNPIPPTLRTVCLEAARRVSINPTGASSETETLGAYSHTSRYESAGGAGGASGLALTADEQRACRRAVYGTLSGTSRPATTLDHLIELRDSGDITL